jgi:SulP family sulfate permease
MKDDAVAPEPARVPMPNKWPATIASGLLTCAVIIIASASLAALIFTGDLAAHLAQGIDIALTSAALIGLIVSLAGSCGVAIAIPQDRTAAILAIMAGAIAATAPAV